jgi:hypothetical protein
MVSIEKEMFVELEYNNLIIDFTSQKLIKINKQKKYYIES